MNWRPGKISPPQLRRGGCAIKKMQRSNRNSRRRGGVDQVRLNSLDQHHPGRSNNVASQLFLCVAATPPQLRRGYPADLQFIQTFYDRAYGYNPRHCRLLCRCGISLFRSNDRPWLRGRRNDRYTNFSLCVICLRILWRVAQRVTIAEIVRDTLEDIS